MKDNGRHRLEIVAPILSRNQWQCWRHRTHGRDPIGEFARQSKRHGSAIRHSVGIDSIGIDVVFGLELVDQVRDESDVAWQSMRSSRPDMRTGAESIKEGAASSRVNNNEAMLIGY